MDEPVYPESIFEECVHCEDYIQIGGYAMMMDSFIVRNGDYWHQECFNEVMERDV